MDRRAGFTVGKAGKTILFLSCVALFWSPDVAGERKHGRAETAGSESDLVWPLPPDPPRIRYLRTHYGSQDYKKKPGRWKRFLLGPTSEAEIWLKKPYGVTTDAEGRVYVTDTGRGAIVVFDTVARRVRLIGNQGQVRLRTPIGVAVDDDGRIFVADADLDRVICFHPDGRALLSIGTEQEMRNPTGLAIDRQRRRLLVADSHLHQILVYSLDGEYLERWGSRGSGEGQFNYPTNVAVGPRGNIHVVDTGNFRVQVFGPDGEFRAAFGKPGDGLGDFHRPKGIALDSEGHIYVADAAFNNYQIFNSDGELLLFVGGLGQEPGNFWLPAGVHIDGSDRIYVVDQVNGRVQVFQYLAEVRTPEIDPASIGDKEVRNQAAN